MLKKLASAVAVLSFLIAGAGEKRALRLDHLRTYVNKGQAAKFKPVSPNAELPLGSFIVLPDKSYPSYRLQVYHHDPANKEEYRRYTLKFTVSADVTLAGHLTFGLKPKNKKYSWYGNFSGSATRGFPLIPGTHQLTVEVDLKQQKLPDLGFVCPMINVTKLTAGTVTINSLEVEIMPSSYQPPKPPPVPEGPGLPGFSVQKNALTHFKWDGKIALTKFTLMMDFTTLGLDIMQLTPANKAVAFQWPSGVTILAENQGESWLISAGDAPGRYSRTYTVNGKNITVAAGAEGVIFRDSANQDIFVSGGLNTIGRTLLIPNGSPVIKVRPLRIIENALAMIVVEEAERTLAHADKIFKDNGLYIKQAWSGNNNIRPWSNVFNFHRENLTSRRNKLIQETEKFLPILLEQRSVRDRFAQIVYAGELYFHEAAGHWGDTFYRNYFKFLDGQPEVQAALQFARKVDSLVSRARRVSDASFKEGSAVGNIGVSAGFAESSLTHTFRRAGSPEKLFRSISLDLAAGEAESAQLVLSTARRGVQDLAVKVTPAAAAAPEVKLYLMDYITLMAEPNAQLPLTLGGDVEMPDVLKNYTAGTPFDMESYVNQPVQIDITSAPDTRPGTYEYTVEVLHKGEILAQLPLTVKVRSFSFGEDYIPTLGGWRYAAFGGWHGDKLGRKARENSIKAMIDHRLCPSDLYAYCSFDAEELTWAIKQGLRGINLGRSQLESMAHPEADMGNFIQLFGSADGENFIPIDSASELVSRKTDNGIEELDLVITPKGDTSAYRYIKVHNSEIRTMRARPVQKFFLMEAASSYNGKVAQMTLADGTIRDFDQMYSRRQDLAPTLTGISKMRLGSSFWMDNLRTGENLGSVIFDKGTDKVISIRLINTCISRTVRDLKKKYDFIRSVPGGDKIDIYLYGFDESMKHLNIPVISAFSNVKKFLPQDIKIVSTIAEPIMNQEIYKYMDIHCPTNAFAYPRFNKQMHDKYGTKLWSYVGGGGYYPFANFERVDQPLIFARAFPWEMIGFEFIEGMLYWDYHLWRFNTQFIGSNDIDWSRWNDTHNTNNGMGAIFYPGPNGESYPSRRATALRDGLDDVLAVRLARRLVAAKPAEEQLELKAQLQKICDGFCSSMTVYCKDIQEMNKTRTALYDFIERIKR
ncbi:MAG: DUF4091 domain-containing protein [Lentisphaerae bacterium]|nr:DUF4091 domain-containing protein [Lentisphaerota bacterium]